MMTCTTPLISLTFLCCLLLVSSVAAAVEFVKLADVTPNDNYVLIKGTIEQDTPHFYVTSSCDHLICEEEISSLESALDVGSDNGKRFRFPLGPIPFDPNDHNAILISVLDHTLVGVSDHNDKLWVVNANHTGKGHPLGLDDYHFVVLAPGYSDPPPRATQYKLIKTTKECDGTC